ncbi:MAG: DUF1611 domain-containing protein [Deltaproteobacteria bacterium]|nr:DUF1611 domain-containing protein [Deltaproteobacteria bacterium]
MDAPPDGNAVIYCEGAFNTTNGKTAHGLVRRTRRYRVMSVVDSRYQGRDAGDLLDGRPSGIPVFESVRAAVKAARGEGHGATHLVVGIAPDGGRLSPAARKDVLEALDLGLHVDAGLHDFLSEDPDMARLAGKRGVRIRDVREPPPREALHFFSGRIEEVTAFRVAVLGTDSAVGKRTTAWLVRDRLEQEGLRSELVGTGQTAWLQGVRFGVIMDSIVNDFVAGEIEHAVWSAWKEGGAGALVIEGQGSLMNPAYPGGFEILAAARPDAVVLQHAPARREYDGFPGYPIHPLALQIQAVELLSGRPVAAVAVNHEGLDEAGVEAACREIAETTGLPACDVLRQGVDPLLEGLSPFLERWKRGRDHG